MSECRRHSAESLACSRFLSWSAAAVCFGVRRVVDMRLEAAAPAQIKGQRRVLDAELVGDEFVAGPIVTGNSAGHGELGSNDSGRTDLHPRGRAHEPSARSMIELDRGATYSVCCADSRAEILEGCAPGRPRKMSVSAENCSSELPSSTYRMTRFVRLVVTIRSRHHNASVGEIDSDVVTKHSDSAAGSLSKRRIMREVWQRFRTDSRGR